MLENYFPPSTPSDLKKSGGFLEILLGGILGKDANGNLKSIDLGKFIKLPDVNLKADEAQASNVFKFIGLAALSIILYKPIKKWIS